MVNLHEVRVIASLHTAQVDGESRTKAMIKLAVGKNEDVKLAMAISAKDVGAGENELDAAGVKDFVQDWKKYAHLHNFTFRDETDLRLPIPPDAQVAA